MLAKFAFWETAFPDKHINYVSEICILGNGVSQNETSILIRLMKFAFWETRFPINIFGLPESNNDKETAAINVFCC